jgi:AraC-like DNA-binding protein
MTVTTKIMKPDKSLCDFVESFWMLYNQSAHEKEVVILPDGRIDLFFSQSATEPFHITLLGLGTEALQTKIQPKTLIFAISFKPLATEYILHATVAGLLNGARQLPTDFWGFGINDLADFDHFCKKASRKIQELLIEKVDARKQKLFELIFASNGSMPVKELSEKVYWSSRQINRYFNQQVGISLKAYCNILRFRASLQQIKDGKLFPEQKFADQTHFIKEIKKFSGVVPKELSKNQNDRFILLSVLPKE